MQLRNIPIQEIKDKAIHLTKLFNFRYVVLHHFPDYNCFKGYYGILSKEAEKHAKADHDIFFFQLINGYRNFLRGEFDNEQFEIPIVKDTFHPVLKGRFYGLMILTQNNYEHEEWFNRIMFQAKKTENKIGYFLEIIPELIIVKKIDYLTIIYDLYYEEIFDKRDWEHYSNQNIHLIGLALTEINSNQLKIAESTLSFVDIENSSDSYYNYIKILYYIVKYQLFKKFDKKNDMLKQIENKYLDIITKTEFYYFDLEYLRRYF